MTGTRTRGIELGPGRSVEVTLTEAGTGRTVLVLTAAAVPPPCGASPRTCPAACVC